MRAGLGRLLYRLHLPLIRRLLNDSQRVRVIIFDDQRQRVLLVKNLLGRQRWSLPGGGIQSKETPVQAARRELKEELKLDIATKDFKLINDFDHQESDIEARWRAYILVCQIPLATPLNRRRAEILENAWFELSHLPRNISELTRNAIEDLSA